MSDIRVILADDHHMVRQGLAQVLSEQDPGIKVVGQASDGAEVLELAATADAQVIVLDYGLPGLDGAAVTIQLRRSHPEIHVVILTMHDNVHYVLKALDAGARGFVVKSDAAEELVKAIHTVSAGGKYISSHLAGKVEQHLQRPKGRHIGLEKLSQREFELLRLMSRGKSLQECARLMHISESTTSTYRLRLMTKLELTHNAEIIRFALENDITG